MVVRLSPRAALAACALFVLAACATTTPPAAVHPIDELLDRPPLDRAIWAVLVEEEDGRVVYERNADKLAIPASNRKLFAAATIATCLGASSQLTTEIWRDGYDLVIRGDGDPSLGSWRYERHDDFDALAQQLRAGGLTRVRDVIADVSAFDRVIVPGGWKHGNLGADYAAPVDAIAWGENEVPVNRSIPDPGLHAATALREALFLRGIDVAGVARVNTERRAWQERVATIPSPFVGDLLRPVLKNSHNLYTEMLLKRIARVRPATYDDAFEVERAFLLSDVRLDDGSFRFVDGSGLAPDNLVTPRATIRMLRWMNDPARRAFWWSVLAQAAGEGTLRRRLIALENRVAGKTGTINSVNALSGIVAMPDGRYRYFSIMVNHHLADDDAVGAIDAVVERVASPGLTVSQSHSRTGAER